MNRIPPFTLMGSGLAIAGWILAIPCFKIWSYCPEFECTPDCESYENFVCMEYVCDTDFPCRAGGAPSSTPFSGVVKFRKLGRCVRPDGTWRDCKGDLLGVLHTEECCNCEGFRWAPQPAPPQ
ncbi:MAG: hypothetical protein K6T17_01905 [Fimbriimonadales bacterium]|nr:hypothetical protein [Fimbriimonadales bacterium]